MHYHVDWSSTGFGSESFDSYPEAHEAAHRVIEDNRLSQSGTRPLPTSNETLKIDLFDEACPVCEKHKGARV
jgi:hypothetical protein